MIGPAIGGVAAAITGEPTVVFWVAGIALGRLGGPGGGPGPGHRPRPARPDVRLVAARSGRGRRCAADAAASPSAASSTGLLVAAIVFNVGSFFAGGSYEVVWSLYLTSLGAGLDAVGLTLRHVLAARPAPVAVHRSLHRQGGRVHRRSSSGWPAIAVCGALYPLIPQVWFVVVLGLVEGTAFAFASPALYLLVARASPPGRSSTAQGLFGAAGTIGTIVASLLAGALAQQDLRYPFFASAIGTAVALVLGLAIGRRRLWDVMQPSHLGALPAPVAVAGRVPARPRRLEDEQRPSASAGSRPLGLVAPPAPTVLVLGGFLTSPPIYRPFVRSLRERGAAEVVVGGVWTPDWLLAAVRGLGPILTRSGRALLAASARSSVASLGAPVLVIGHSAGGMSARLLTSPVPFAGRRLNASGRIGAIVTLGTPHVVSFEGLTRNRTGAEAAAFANRVVPGPFFAPRVGYLAVASRVSPGRPDGAVRERRAWALYQGLLPQPGASVVEGDGLIPLASALLPGAPSLVLDDAAHGQSPGRDWYGSDGPLDRWWPAAVETWRSALRARTGTPAAGQR